ncbi:MAG: dodecin family protein [Candidatus Nitrosopolaris sp.]
MFGRWHYGLQIHRHRTSNTVITDAINNAFEEASKTVKNIKWGELGRVTFRVEEGKKIEYQAEVRIGFEVIRDNEDRDT